MYLYNILFTLPKTTPTNRNVFSRTLYDVGAYRYKLYTRYMVDYFSKITIRSYVFSLFFFIQFCPDNFTLCVRVRDRHLLKTCFKHFIRVDESWKGLLLVSVQLHCRVKSHQTHTSVHAVHTYCYSKLFPVYHRFSTFIHRLQYTI